MLEEGDELIGVELTDGENEILLGTRKGQAVRFSERHVRSMGRMARGVHSMKLAPDDAVIDMAALEEGGRVISITENGYGKRTDPEEYRMTSRNAKGVAAMKLTEKTGLLAAQLIVQDGEDLLLITDSGTMIRTPVDEIRLCGRVSQGVRLMRLQEGCRVIGVARAQAEEEEDEASGDGTEIRSETETPNDDGNDI